MCDTILIRFVSLDKDPKCRYRVHYPEASWNTAYDVCSRDNMTLAKASTPIEIHLIDIVLHEALLILSGSLMTICLFY